MSANFGEFPQDFDPVLLGPPFAETRAKLDEHLGTLMTRLPVISYRRHADLKIGFVDGEVTASLHSGETVDTVLGTMDDDTRYSVYLHEAGVHYEADSPTTSRPGGRLAAIGIAALLSPHESGMSGREVRWIRDILLGVDADGELSPRVARELMNTSLVPIVTEQLRFGDYEYANGTSANLRIALPYDYHAPTARLGDVGSLSLSYTLADGRAWAYDRDGDGEEHRPVSNENRVQLLANIRPETEIDEEISDSVIEKLVAITAARNKGAFRASEGGMRHLVHILEAAQRSGAAA